MWYPQYLVWYPQGTPSTLWLRLRHPRLQACKRLDEEAARVDFCLHETTGPKIKDCLEQILIRDYDKKLIDVCLAWWCGT